MKQTSQSPFRNRTRYHFSDQMKLHYIIKGFSNPAHIPARRFHRHPFLEIHFAVRGKCIIHVEKEEIITSPGQLVIFNPDDFHAENIYGDEEAEFYSIAFSGLQCAGLPKDHLTAAEMTHAVFLDRYEPLFRTLSDALYHETKSSEDAGTPVVHHMTSLMAQIIFSALESSGSQLSDQSAPSEYVSERIRRYLCYHFEEDITLEKLASVMNTSPSTISHIFKRHLGISPIQYLQRIRIGEAQTLLGSSDLSIQEIALRTGYNSPDHFYLIFRKNTGMSPIQYRKLQKNIQTKNDL